MQSKSPFTKTGPRPHLRIPVSKRFFQFVPDRPENECWPWYGGRDSRLSHGLIWDSESGRQLYAHRVSWEIHRGKIPKDHVVSAICETPCCTNPKHLICGHRAKIISKRLRLSKKGARYGDANKHTRFPDAEVQKIRQLHKERRFKEITAIAKSWGMSRDYLIALGRGRGRTRKPRKSDVGTRYYQ